jgi:hypothetical protein
MQARADKARFRVYSPNSELEKKLGRIFFWQSKLKDAMTEERLVAYYQPMLNNKTGDLEMNLLIFSSHTSFSVKAILSVSTPSPKKILNERVPTAA